MQYNTVLFEFTYLPTWCMYRILVSSEIQALDELQDYLINYEQLVFTVHLSVWKTTTKVLLSRLICFFILPRGAHTSKKLKSYFTQYNYKFMYYLSSAIMYLSVLVFTVTSHLCLTFILKPSVLPVIGTQPCVGAHQEGLYGLCCKTAVRQEGSSSLRC